MVNYWCLFFALQLSILIVAPISRSNASALENSSIVVLVKIGGSSITHKAKKESLNAEALNWFARTVSSTMSLSHNKSCPSAPAIRYIIVHGAGSFGHHFAKEFGLKGQSEPPPKAFSENIDRGAMMGLSRTRLSVQMLNHHVVSALVSHNVSAVGISPCFGIPGLQAHHGLSSGGNQDGNESSGNNAAQSPDDPLTWLGKIVSDTLRAGLVPVLHGDACLYGDKGAGILSGDGLMQAIGSSDFVHHAIFITDVDGVFTVDPRQNADATLIRFIDVDPADGHIRTRVKATNYHAHDVTGGLATKISAAASLAKGGTDVIIVKSGSPSAEQALRGRKDYDTGTLVRKFSE